MRLLLYQGVFNFKNMTSKNGCFVRQQCCGGQCVARRTSWAVFARSVEFLLFFLLVSMNMFTAPPKRLTSAVRFSLLGVYAVVRKFYKCQSNIL